MARTRALMEVKLRRTAPSLVGHAEGMCRSDGWVSESGVRATRRFGIDARPKYRTARGEARKSAQTAAPLPISTDGLRHRPSDALQGQSQPCSQKPYLLSLPDTMT